MLSRCFAIELGKRFVDRLIKDSAASYALIDHRWRDFPFAETWDSYLLGNRSIGLGNVWSEFIETDFDRKTNASWTKSFDRTLHKGLLGTDVGFLVGAERLELSIFCSQSRRASHYATPRGAGGESRGQILKTSPEPIP